MTVFWISFLATTATAALLIRLFFLYSEYVRLNVSRLPSVTETTPAHEVSEEEKVTGKKKSKSAKKAAKKKPAKKSKKKKN
jgi:hypothetical protein